MPLPTMKEVLYNSVLYNPGFLLFKHCLISSNILPSPQMSANILKYPEGDTFNFDSELRSVSAPPHRSKFEVKV